MVQNSDECLKCDEHKAWEERMKVLDKVPSILSWMNYMKGAIAVIIVFLTMFVPLTYNHIMTTRAESNAAIEKQNMQIKDTKDTLSAQVLLLSQSAMTISKDVAIFIARSELKQTALENEVVVIKAECMKIKRAN